jgi:hypothetical protein
MKDLGMIPTRGVCLPYGALSSVAGTWAKHAHGSMWQRSNSRRPYDRGTGYPPMVLVFLHDSYSLASL